MVRFRRDKHTKETFPIGPDQRLATILTTDEDRQIWDEVSRYQGRTADELDQYLRSHGYQLANRVYVDGGPDRGRGGELWLSRTGFPIKAETRDGVVVRIQRKVVF